MRVNGALMEKKEAKYSILFNFIFKHSKNTRINLPFNLQSKEIMLSLFHFSLKLKDIQ